MPTITEYGTLTTFIDGGATPTLTAHVTGALSDAAADFDVPALTSDYRDHIAALLTRYGLTVAGDRVYGPYPRDLTDRYVHTLQEKVAFDIDFWAIAERYDRATS